ncbi:hypothetical protein DITRI_Ditri03aG0087100 [Diplodiscus trichospermus]
MLFCAWALGNVVGEGEELRNVLLSQGALPPLARMMLPNKGSTVRTVAWALSNFIKGPDPKIATELIKVDGVLVKSDILLFLMERLATSNSLQLLILVLRSLGNLVADDLLKTYIALVHGHDITTSEELERG